MKPYVVEWDDEATRMLADIFLRALNPNVLWPAQDRADRRLEQQPESQGVELSEGLWQIIEPPLKIFYEIDASKRLVIVTHVELT
jgi:hypothetical protein